jgi:hypothetical protein
MYQSVGVVASQVSTYVFHKNVSDIIATPAKF